MSGLVGRSIFSVPGIDGDLPVREVGSSECDAILGAMRQVALAGDRAVSHADTTSIAAAGHYLLRRAGPIDVGTLPAVEPVDLLAALGDRELAHEAMKYLTVMALVDGRLDRGKLRRVLEYARTLDVEEHYLTEIVEAASGHMAWSLADMTRKNMESITGRKWDKNQDTKAWFLPYAGDRAQPDLVARYERLGALPDPSFGKSLWRFYKKNGYSFPGDPAALTEELCRRIAIIRAGRIVAEKPTSELIADGASLQDVFLELTKR